LNLETTFAQILTNRTISKPRQSSLIQQWLGTPDVPQYLSIRIGNYLEELFNTILGELSILSELPLKGKQRIITYNNEDHQVDIVARIGPVIYHRELKANTDLDRGKKRDVLRREQSIAKALADRYPGCVIDSCVFCPFFDTSRQVSGLGRVEGLADFIDTFSLKISVEQFKALGKAEQIHTLLLLK